MPICTIFATVYTTELVFHAVSTSGTSSNIITIQAYLNNDNMANTYITGTHVSTMEEAMDAMRAIKDKNFNHWAGKWMNETINDIQQ